MTGAVESSPAMRSARSDLGSGCSDSGQQLRAAPIASRLPGNDFENAEHETL